MNPMTFTAGMCAANTNNKYNIKFIFIFTYKINNLFRYESYEDNLDLELIATYATTMDITIAKNSLFNHGP